MNNGKRQQLVEQNSQTYVSNTSILICRRSKCFSSSVTRGGTNRRRFRLENNRPRNAEYNAYNDTYYQYHFCCYCLGPMVLLVWGKMLWKSFYTVVKDETLQNAPASTVG